MIRFPFPFAFVFFLIFFLSSSREAAAVMSIDQVVSTSIKSGCLKHILFGGGLSDYAKKAKGVEAPKEHFNPPASSDNYLFRTQTHRFAMSLAFEGRLCNIYVFDMTRTQAHQIAKLAFKGAPYKSLESVEKGEMATDFYRVEMPGKPEMTTKLAISSLKSGESGKVIFGLSRSD